MTWLWNYDKYDSKYMPKGPQAYISGYDFEAEEEEAEYSPETIIRADYFSCLFEWNNFLTEC